MLVTSTPCSRCSNNPAPCQWQTNNHLHLHDHNSIFSQRNGSECTCFTNVGPPVLFIAVALFWGHHSRCHSWKIEERRRFTVSFPYSLTPKLHTFQSPHVGNDVNVTCDLRWNSLHKLLCGSASSAAETCVKQTVVKVRTYRLCTYRVTILHRHLRHASTLEVVNRKLNSLSNETHYVSATKPNRLTLFGETVTVYCENNMEHTNSLPNNI
jgi:hypothetical protein